MPGKVNPVMAESLMQVCAQVIGNDAAITLGGLAGQFRAERDDAGDRPTTCCSRSPCLPTRVTLFTDAACAGSRPTAERCEALVEESLAMVTALAPVIGYDRAAQIAKEAHETGKTVRQVALEENVLPAAELNALLDPRPMTEPGVPGKTR